VTEQNINLAREYTNNSGIAALSKLLSLENDTETVVLNFSALRWIELGPMTYLLGTLKGWQENGITINFIGVPPVSSPINYLSRMNFFELLGHPISESFIRRDAGNRFVDFKSISDSSSNTADSLSESMATCITGETDSPDVFEFTDTPPENGFFDAIAYAVSELIKNVQQHSWGTGYIGAQFYPRSGETQIAIVDTGIGIKESFERSSSPYANNIKSDLDALAKALEPEVSSKTYPGDPLASSAANAGVGLTLLTDVAVQAKGSYQIASGNGLVGSQGNSLLHNAYKGTFVCLSFNRSELEQFQNLLENAKSKILGDVDIDPLALEGIFEG